MRYGLRVEGKDLIETYARTRAEGFGAGGAPARHDRHLRALGRLLRRLLPQGAAGPDAILDDFKAAFERVDLMLTPATPTAAFRIGDKMDDPVAM